VQPLELAEDDNRTDTTTPEDKEHLDAF